MKLSRLVSKAKKTIDERGGVEALKEDARELKEVAGRKGSLKDKAKDAAAAIKEPGARRSGEQGSEGTGGAGKGGGGDKPAA